MIDSQIKLEISGDPAIRKFKSHCTDNAFCVVCSAVLRREREFAE